jgi:hypothetical protein
MKHLLKKISSRGGGSKKPKVTPAVLNPPSIGTFQFGSSFSISETIDLISDGPIEGLVDPEGNKLPESEISRGVYLDGTAVSVTNKNFGTNQPPRSNLNISVEETSFSEVFGSFPSNAHSHLSFGVRYSKYTPYAFPTIRQWRRGSLQDYRRIPGTDTWEHLTHSSNKVDDSFYGKGVIIGKYIPLAFGDVIGSPTQNRGGREYRKFGSQWSFVQLNSDPNKPKPFTEATLICFNGADDSYAVNSKSNLAGLQFFFDRREAEARGETSTNNGSADIDHDLAGPHPLAPPGKASKGAMTPFLELIDELKSLINQDGTITNQEYYDLIETTLTNALGNYQWETLNVKEELENIVFKLPQSGEPFSDGQIILYYPPRDLLSGFADTIISNPKNIKFELFRSGVDVPFDLLQSSNVYNLLVPVMKKEGDDYKLTGDIIGAYIIHIPHTYWKELDPNLEMGNDSEKNLVELGRGVGQAGLIYTGNSNLKYNYTNILIEQRLGGESQNPLNYFNKVSIDKNYNRILYGPYRTEGQIQRIVPTKYKDAFSQYSADFGLGVSLNSSTQLPINEGSNDTKRMGRNSQPVSFSTWNSDNASNFTDEEGVSVTHVVHNPNVSQASITLRIDSLYDSLEIDKDTGNDPNIFKAGDKIPTIVNVEIEVGILTRNGKETPFDSRTYRIAALVESTTLLDIGNPDQGSKGDYKHVMLSGDKHNRPEKINVPFDLPPVRAYSSSSLDGSFEKRYVKVTKLSTETFSVLVSKDITLSKVTEIIPSYFTYPFSSIFGVKLDTRTFSSIPERTYDSRLKRIKIPSNYFPTSGANAKDKRYYKTEKELEESIDSDKQLYNGDWNGTFKEGWTDNPAWILFDLLTNTRYGLGQQVSETEINKWELYKIGRFCDAVDENGNFVGVPDGRGGLEPRFSCNILFNSKEKVFDAIQLISDLFRGKTFFRNSEISFIDQRVKEPIATFSNINVKDGIFNYSNFRRDQQFNTVEVAYKDRFENFAPKIEVIEDSEDIRNRGVFKTTIEAAGVTSRAMALRIGEHLIYKTIKENQRIAFSSGLEALLCQPGDLIMIDDELKSNKSNFGKIMSVDIDNQYIRLSGPFSPTSMTGILTVYNPTGKESISGLNDLAAKKRSRYESFSITGSADPDFNMFTGDYSFSGYKDGYSVEKINEYERDEKDDVRVQIDLFEEYACYTGTGDNTLYFNTGFTGWVFASGLIYQDNEDNDKFISDTGVAGNTLFGIDNSSGVYEYDGSAADRRLRTVYRDLSGYFTGLQNSNDLDYGGVLESEISVGVPSQIVTLNVAGGGLVGDVVGERGSYVSGVDKPEYLSAIKVGSPYRYEVKDASDIIYQVDSIREENPNEYLVAAIKFDTGKYDLIEKNISIERKENTFAYSVATQVGDKTYTNLDRPASLALTTGEDVGGESFYISGAWPQVTNNNGYDVNLHYPNGVVENSGISQNVTGVKFTGITSVGNFFMAVKALGDQTSDSANVYFDSEYTTIRSFFLYEDIASLDRPIITNINFR